jgi:uracil-DNA glycosylase
VRRRNLQVFLEAAIDARVDTIWIARDLGYRGGRRTGVPLTDEVHLDQAAALLGGISLDRSTQGPVVAERTAAIVWRVLGATRQPAVLWNVFPLHPHERGDAFSNRCHTRAERELTEPLLHALIKLVRPKQLVAIGRDAQLALQNIGVPVVGVRHPSYGGQADFINGISSLYGIAPDAGEQSPEFSFGQAAKTALAHA